MKKPFALALVSLLAVAASGCGKTLIPNTDVEDTSENRKAILVCEQYRHALEERNVGLLMQIASPRYYEDGGNTRVDDDIDFKGLEAYLTGVFQKTSNVRYEMRYRNVTFSPKKDVYVDYTYSASFKIPGLHDDEWHHRVADNRLVLEPTGDGYKIVSGM